VVPGQEGTDKSAMGKTDFPWALLDNQYNNRFQKLSLQEVPVRQLTLRSAWNYRLFLERPEWFNYTTPGMFAMLGKRNPETGRIACRAYSIVSAPHEDLLEFYIALTVENVNELPELTEDDPNKETLIRQYPYVSMLLEDVVEREEVIDPRLNNVLLGQATLGSFRFDTTDRRIAVFGFTGTGVAAGVPIVREHPWSPAIRKGILLHGVRNPADFAYQDEFKEHRRQYPEFQYHMFLSRDAGTPWHYSSGRITRVLAPSPQEMAEAGDVHPFEKLTGVPYDPNHIKIYLCGSDAMIKQVTDYAMNQRGFEKRDIVAEKFFD
jgi:ferredoxin-NADP reductase